MQQHIDPDKEYSLNFLVKNRLFGDIKQYATARKYVYEDLLGEKILDAKLSGQDRHRSITIKGENLIKYLYGNRKPVA